LAKLWHLLVCGIPGVLIRMRQHGDRGKMGSSLTGQALSLTQGLNPFYNWPMLVSGCIGSLRECRNGRGRRGFVSSELLFALFTFVDGAPPAVREPGP
jgi:hypothetical protein